MRKNTWGRQPFLPWLAALIAISLLLGAVLLPRTPLRHCYAQGELILAATLPAAGTAAASLPTDPLPTAQPLLAEESLLLLPAVPAQAKPQGPPQAVIYCTHTSENYSDGKRVNGKPGGVMQAAKALAEGLEDRGVQVILDETVHDSPSYDTAYASSLASLTAIKQRYPDIQLYVDVHRDSAIDGVSTRLTNEQGSFAKIMLVIGTDETYDHPNWQKNAAFAQAVNTELNALAPGVTREPRTSSNRYNQHIAEKAILVEIGSDDNSAAEAVRSAAILAQALANVMGW